MEEIRKINEEVDEKLSLGVRENRRVTERLEDGPTGITGRREEKRTL